jgi:Domain of unknown function (DUF4402)
MVALLAGAGSVTTPAMAASKTGTANAIALRPLSIVNTEDLDFGTLLPSVGVAGTVTIDPNSGARSTTGGVSGAGGTPRAGEFVTYGGPLQTLQVNRGPLPLLSRVGGGATMAVTQLTLDGPVTRFLGAAGTVVLKIGATMNVAANQLDGSYAGTYQIIVTYF